MSVVRIISATLFALVLLVIAYGAFWFSAFRYAETVMSNLAMRQMGITATFNAPQWLPEPARVAVRLPNVEARFVPAGTSVSVVVKLPEVQLFSGFFDNGKHMVIRLPQTFDVTMSLNGVSKNLKVMTSQAEVGFLGDQFRMSAATLRVLDAQGSQLLLLQDGSFNQKNSGSYPVVRVMAKNVSGAAGTLDDLVIEATLKALPQAVGGVWQVAFGGTKADVKVWVGGFIQAMKAGGVIDITQFLFRNGDTEGSLFGQLSVDQGGYLNSEMTMMSSSDDLSKAWVAKSGLIKSAGIEEELRLKQVYKRLEPDQPVMNMVFHQRMLILNTQKVGKIAPLMDAMNALLQ